MSRLFKLLLALLVAASTLFASVVAPTHSHRADSLDGRTVSSTCDCHFHSTEDRNSDKLPEQDQDDDTCLICRLIADFQAEAPLVVEFEFGSMVLAFVAPECCDVALQPMRLFQGRAPPTADA